MRLVFCIIFLKIVVFAQPWVMFNDLDDTYLYDQATGQVYIRVKKGGKNYEDTFVKMGVVDLKNNSKNPKNNKDNTKEAEVQKTQDAMQSLQEQKKLLEQAQELQKSIQGTIFNAN